MKPFVLVRLFFLLVTVSAYAKARIKVIEGIVLKVTDGDTIQLQDKLGMPVILHPDERTWLSRSITAPATLQPSLTPPT